MEKVDFLEVSIYDYCWIRVVVIMACCGGCDSCEIICSIANVCAERGIPIFE